MFPQRMDYSQSKRETENGYFTEQDDASSSENNFLYEKTKSKHSEETKVKKKCEKGPPIVCLMCKTIWTKSQKGGRLFMFGGTRPFMAKFEAKFKLLLGQEDLSALKQKSATKFGRSYICRECFLIVKQTYDSIRTLQRNVARSISRIKSLDSSIAPSIDQTDSGSEEDLEIDPQGQANPKQKLPSVADRIAEKIANLLLVKINHKTPVIVLKPFNITTKDGHCVLDDKVISVNDFLISSLSIINKEQVTIDRNTAVSSLHNNDDDEITIAAAKETTQVTRNGESINLQNSKSLDHLNRFLTLGTNISYHEQSSKLVTDNVCSSKEAAECSVISLNMDTSFASQPVSNTSARSCVEGITESVSNNGKEKQVQLNNTKTSLSKCKPSLSELAEILANPLLLIKFSQPIKLADVKNNNVYICGESGCDWIFSSKFFWENHIRHYHRSGKPFICPFDGCQRSFTGKSKLELHVRSHTDERPFICDKCGSGFRGNQELRAHRLTHTSEKPHQCPKCDKNFKLLSSLKRHVQFHDGGDFPFPCTYPECEKSFKSRYDLKCHYRLHTGEKPYKCLEPGCGMAFRIPCQFTMHKRSHTGERPFRCTEDGCSVAYISSNALQTHMLSHTTDRPFCCEFCGKTFKHKILYRMHLKKHSDSQRFHCPVEDCGEEYIDRQTMDQHMATNHGILKHKQQNKFFVCTKLGCGQKYNTDVGLQCHIVKSHKKGKAQCEEIQESRKLVCPYDKCQREYDDCNNLSDHLAKAHMPLPREKMCLNCGQSFPYMEQLEQHVHNMHSQSSLQNQQLKEIFVCNTERCGVHFRRLEDLKHHVTWHLGNPPYSCEFEECKRTFLLEAMSIRHTTEHERNKPYTCSFEHCNEGYTSHMKVLKHSKIHYGSFQCPIDGCSRIMSTLTVAKMHLQQHEKPYVCFLCGKRFTTSSQYLKHKRSHTGDKVFECKVCSCQFEDLDSFKSHKQTHKGEKKYICEECGQGFSSHSSCKNHRKCHSKLPFVCPEEGCGKAFGENSSLKAHMNVHSKPSHLCTQCGKVYKFSVNKHKCKVETDEQIPSTHNIEFIEQQQPLQNMNSNPPQLLVAPPPPAPRPATHSIQQPISQLIPQCLHSIPQVLPQPIPQLITQSLAPPLTQFTPSTLSQPLAQTLPQHPPSQQYMNNMMISEIPASSYMMETGDASHDMRTQFGATDTIVVDPPYYNYIILYDRPVQQ